MPSDPFDLLLGKALVDEKYRAKLLNPKTREAALKDIGIKSPSKVQLQALDNAITTLQTLSNSFSDGFGAA